MPAAMRYLVAVKALVFIESRIGAAATYIRYYAEEEIHDTKLDILELGSAAAHYCRKFQEPDEQARTTRRGKYQSDTEPTPRPGGKMWYGQIADGTLACIGLWLYGDEHGKIVDRVIMKDVWYTELPNIWPDPTWWLGDALDPTTKTPPEASIMMRLTRTKQENVVRIRDWQLSPTKLTCRLYVEYCPYKDATELMHHHITVNRRNQNNASHIEEPALWHIFESLIKAGLVMEQGFTDWRDQPRTARGWSEIAHLDIKPDNVFIAGYPKVNPNKKSENFAMYPTFKLGDLGESTYHDIIGLLTCPRGRYLSRGTRDYLAPEHRTLYYGQERPNLNAKTNVWGVGITMVAMMDLDATAGDLLFEEAARDERDPALVPQFTPLATTRYSPRLRMMVQACMQYLQRVRPDFKTLLDNVRDFTVSHHSRDYAEGARFGTRNAIPPGLTLLNGLPANNYALGMAVPP